MSQPHSLDSPDGLALTWVLDHCLRYQHSYEIPLRTMYTINCNPSNYSLSGSGSPETAFSPRNSTSTKSSRSSQDASVDAASDFRSALMHQISRLPSQPCSLPPSFLISFLRKCFVSELEMVDFPQALPALDYLKTLDNRWKKEMASALERLNVGRDDAADPSRSELASQYPGVAAWLQTVNTKARQIQVLYTQIYVGLRRWTLINELLLGSNNKGNHIAMLNTLYPPISESSPTTTPQLTPQILNNHRNAFFRYINAVEAKGPQALRPVMAQGAPKGETTSWPVVHRTLEKYLLLVNELIDECVLVNEPDHLEEAKTTGRGKSRKVDSGVSFGSSGTEASVDEGQMEEKPLPQFPLPKTSNGKSGGSILERFAREVKALGPSAKARNLRKMKSTTTLGSRPDSGHSSAESSFFEIDEGKRDRLAREATFRKQQSQSQISIH